MRDAFGDGRARRLAPAFVAASRLGGLVTALVLAVLASVAGGTAWFLSDLGTAPRVAILGALATVVLVALLSALLWPPLEYARTRWRLDRDGFEIRRGVLFRHVVNVPLSRVQHTDVAQGPVQRRFDLATLVVHTAGMHEYEVRLEGLSFETALRLRDSLLRGSGGDGTDA